MNYQSIEEVKTKGNFLKAICFKPKTEPFICLIIGIAFLFINNIYARLIGIVFIAMSLLVLIKVKDYKVLDIFDEGILLYEGRENRYGRFVTYDEIKMWAIKHQEGHDYLELELNDGEKIIKDTFEINKAYKTLYSLIKEKEDKYIQAQKNKETPLSIPAALENIRKRFNKK